MRPALFFLVLLLAPLTSFAYPAHGVVLMYHRFEENRYPSTNIRISQFTAQLDYLQRKGYTIWPLRKLLQALHDGAQVPERTVALTVDDAYHSFYQHAYPILKQRDIPLTVFVSTDAVDDKLPGFMRWEQMREMLQHHIDFANHGAAHLHMIHRQDGESNEQLLARVQKDIERAQRRLDKELGNQGQRLLAYPFGEYNTPLANLVQKMGYIAFGQQSGAIGPHSDTRALPRFPLNEHYSSLDTFAVKVSSLPLPITSQVPWEPQLTVNNPPSLTLNLEEDSNVTARQLHCFHGDGTPLETHALTEHSLTVKAGKPLRSGRSRYNCTASAGKHRFYWFSQPWFNGADPADPAY